MKLSTFKKCFLLLDYNLLELKNYRRMALLVHIPRIPITLPHREGIQNKHLMRMNSSEENLSLFSTLINKTNKQTERPDSILGPS